MKPLNGKAYGSIPHLPKSRLGSGDHKCSEGEARIVCEKSRPNDVVICEEKLDGSNVSVAKIEGQIVPLIRAGYRASSSKWKQHHIFGDWVMKERYRFDSILGEGDRVCGEWLLQVHGTRYELPHEPFVIFDFFKNGKRLSYYDRNIVKGMGFVVPKLLSYGQAFSIEQAIESIKTSGHGAIDPVEGAVWRVEHGGDVQFLCKFVHHDKQDGTYLDREIWNTGLDNWFIRKIYG